MQNCSLIHTDICQELSKICKIRVTSKKCIVVGPPGEVFIINFEQNDNHKVIKNACREIANYAT